MAAHDLSQPRPSPSGPAAPPFGKMVHARLCFPARVLGGSPPPTAPAPALLPDQLSALRGQTWEWALGIAKCTARPPVPVSAQGWGKVNKVCLPGFLQGRRRSVPQGSPTIPTGAKALRERPDPGPQASPAPRAAAPHRPGRQLWNGGAPWLHGGQTPSAGTAFQGREWLEAPGMHGPGVGAGSPRATGHQWTGLAQHGTLLPSSGSCPCGSVPVTLPNPAPQDPGILTCRGVGELGQGPQVPHLFLEGDPDGGHLSCEPMAQGSLILGFQWPEPHS